eukprot:COSAG01_NODE_811_length_13417_cov_6.641012_6_plen_49_part_00
MPAGHTCVLTQLCHNCEVIMMVGGWADRYQWCSIKIELSRCPRTIINC